ncbi:hypothetical protein F5Y05DRAFT_206845 [Hypoxylon sp. FL0543]|nr:hypothetical protein F5Y05DRAFT_206845 [Hypoxylon sp. FL0543]
MDAFGGVKAARKSIFGPDIEVGNLLLDVSDQEEEEFRQQLTRYQTRWYRATVITSYEYEEYEPAGRFIEVLTDFPSALDGDWYHANGIPHEVSVPDLRNEGEIRWVSFKYWMRRVARGWFRPVAQVQLNPELFGGVYDRGYVNFFRVMKSRIARQRQYAFWQRIADRRYDDVLTWGFLGPFGGLRFRVRMIVFTLMGFDDDGITNDFAALQNLIRFTRSPAVKLPFLEYYQSWLRFNPNQEAAPWSVIQRAFSDRSPEAQNRRRTKYGIGNYSEMTSISKYDWTHEDHVIRFLISFYHLATIQVRDVNDVDEWQARGWLRYFFINIVSVDWEDKYCPWDTSGRNYTPTMNLRHAVNIDTMDEDEPAELYESESETELDDDGRPRR